MLSAAAAPAPEQLGRDLCSEPSKENFAWAALVQPQPCASVSPCTSAPSPAPFLESSPFPRPLRIIARR